MNGKNSVASDTAGKELLAAWTLRDYIRETIIFILKWGAWALQLLCFFIPIKKHRIVIYSLTQHGYGCNLKYLTEYLHSHKEYSYEILWIVSTEQAKASLQQRGIPVALLHSGEHLCYRHRAGIVITNDEFYSFCRKRRGQLFVNTWHGGINYKQIGYSGIAFSNRFQRLNYKLKNPKPDIIVAGSRSFEQTYGKAYFLPASVFLPVGLPRNDILFQKKQEPCDDTITKELSLEPSVKLLLYAPTFRRYATAPPALPWREVCEVLRERFGGKWIILLRYHPFVNTEELAIPPDEFTRDVSQWEDMQELLVRCDAMISDYSSCMWDYSFTGRPCFVYAEDMTEYRQNDRSFSIPPEQWPYPVATHLQELYENIRQFDDSEYQKKIRAHHLAMGSYEQGNACEQLVKNISIYQERTPQ